MALEEWLRSIAALAQLEDSIGRLRTLNRKFSLENKVAVWAALQEFFEGGQDYRSVAGNQDREGDGSGGEVTGNEGGNSSI